MIYPAFLDLTFPIAARASAFPISSYSFEGCWTRGAAGEIIRCPPRPVPLSQEPERTQLDRCDLWRRSDANRDFFRVAQV